MTEDERSEFRAMLREELAAAAQTITAASSANLTDLRNELLARFTDIDRRLDRYHDELLLIQTSMVSLNRWAERLDKDQAALGQNYFTQQRAIEDLRRRVEAIEKKAS
jgi:chromosome segregation ATPase